MTDEVRGRFVRAGLGPNGAYSELFLEGARAQEVEDMFKEAPPSSFFATATMRNRVVTPEGQEGDENPLGALTGHVDMMHARITNIPGDGDGYDVGGRFSGFLRGAAPVDIDQEPGGVRIRETGTRVRPDLTRVPIAGAVQQAIEENVPVMGAMAKAGRRATEAMMGTVFEGVHALLARSSAETIAGSLNKKRRTGRW